MKDLLRRQRGIVAGLAIIGALAWAGPSLTIPHASGSNNTMTTTSTEVQAAQGFIEVAKRVTPAIVNITRSPETPVQNSHSFTPRGHAPGNMPEWMDKFFESPGRSPFPPGPESPTHGMGSGVIVSADGYILTNNHVVEGVKYVKVSLPDKREFKGKVVGNDPKTDLAVVKIEGNDFPYVSWGDSSKLQVGEAVLAIGNPFGLNSTVTQGIVSALGRGRMGITQYEDFIQTDAAINPGNSGGALVNLKGELVGINTAIFSRSGGYQGIGFAVPTSMANPVYASLIKNGKVVRGFLGINIQDVTKDLADSFDLKEAKGALVGDVKIGSPADKGGLQRGDIILSYEGTSVEDPVALQRLVTGTPVGEQATMKIFRDGKEQTMTVTIGQQDQEMKIAKTSDSSTEHALTGLAVRELDSHTARKLGLQNDDHGVVITHIAQGSGADRAGLMRGDVIREVNRQPVKSVHDFEEAASDLEKNKSALLLINRGGSSLFVTVKI